jgi:CubicO group peptidase (beta-lactamase class C family)
MEKASGNQYHQILEEYITDTLHLENTVVDHPFITIKNRADYFDFNYIMQVVNATFRDMRYRAPSEGLLSSAEDLVKFGNAILFSEYIPDNVKKKLFEPVELPNTVQSNMANGWMLIKTGDGETVYGRGGSVTGGSAVLLIYPEQKIVIAGAGNLNVGPENIPVFEMARPFLMVSSGENTEEK